MNQKRRVFLKQTAVASAAVALFPSCITSPSGSQIPEIGLQLYTVRNEMEKDPIGTLEKIAKIGYKKVETVGYSDSRLYGFSGKEFKGVLDDLGLKNTSGHFALDVFQNSFDEALDFMIASGQQYVVLGWLEKEERVSLDQYKIYAEMLNRCAEKAAQANIQVCYHNHDFEFREIDGKLPMNVLLMETDPELVDIELDLYWITKVGLDPLSFFNENKGRVPLWHVKDLADTPERGFAEVGNGVIDFKAIFDEKDISGMKHFFVEQDESDNPLQSIETSFNNLIKEILV